MKKNIAWLAAFIVITIIFGTIYATVQQSLRLSANDPQIQMAEDTAWQLDHGANPNSIIRGEVNVNHSSAPFIVVYDKTTGEPVASSGTLNERVPLIPVGVLKASEGRAYNSVTWQPTSTIRLASVTVSGNKYYVTVARSLKEVEQREDQTFWLACIGWLVSVGVLGAVFWLTARR